VRDRPLQIEIIMPTERIPLAKRHGYAREVRQAPEPRNRMLRREHLRDRHQVKQQLNSALRTAHSAFES
jgi:hypothetical protein